MDNFLKSSLIIFSLFLLFLFVNNIAFAETNEIVGIKTLQFAMDHVNCRIDFVTKYVNNLAVVAPDSFSDPSQYLATIQKDQMQLKNYSSSGDVNGFRTYVKSTYDPDYKQLKGSIKNQLSKVNLTDAQLNSIRKNFDLNRINGEKCAFKALNEYSTEKVNTYNLIVTNYQLEMFSLSSKGIDIYPLVTLLKKEYNQIILPLSTVVNTVNPNINASSDLRIALNNYCLFDGCLAGLNGHLSGNFEATKLQIIINHMKHDPRYNQAYGILSQAQDSLNIAETTLASIGTSSYASPEQINSVWGNIYATSKALRSVVNTFGD